MMDTIPGLVKPSPPPGRYICNVCGVLKDGKHTNWICKLFEWVYETRG